MSCKHSRNIPQKHVYRTIYINNKLRMEWILGNPDKQNLVIMPTYNSQVLFIKESMDEVKPSSKI